MLCRSAFVCLSGYHSSVLVVKWYDVTLWCWGLEPNMTVSRPSPCSIHGQNSFDAFLDLLEVLRSLRSHPDTFFGRWVAKIWDFDEFLGTNRHYHCSMHLPRPLLSCSTIHAPSLPLRMRYWTKQAAKVDFVVFDAATSEKMIYPTQRSRLVSALLYTSWDVRRHLRRAIQCLLTCTCAVGAAATRVATLRLWH